MKRGPAPGVVRASRGWSLVPKSNGFGSLRQKRPLLRQHRLKRLPLPQGQRSLRPSCSSSHLPPCTTRTPTLTRVSDGYPRRRLLMGSKGPLFVEFLAHGTPPSETDCSIRHDTCRRPEVRSCRSNCGKQAASSHRTRHVFNCLRTNGSCGGLVLPLRPRPPEQSGAGRYLGLLRPLEHQQGDGLAGEGEAQFGLTVLDGYLGRFSQRRRFSRGEKLVLLNIRKTLSTGFSMPPVASERKPAK